MHDHLNASPAFTVSGAVQLHVKSEEYMSGRSRPLAAIPAGADLHTLV